MNLSCDRKNDGQHGIDQSESELRIEIIRSRRKTVEIRVNVDLSVTVRAPLRMSRREIDDFLRKKEAWIRKNICRMEDERRFFREQGEHFPGPEEIRELKDRAYLVIPEKVAYFAKILGVNYGRITIRVQKTRWGSCSSKGNLSFNCLLMKAPPEVLDYVVVHELCHRKEMNHSPQFWNEVEKVQPGYREPKKWLKDRGNVLIQGAGTSGE